MSLRELLARPFADYGELIRARARVRPQHIALIEGERRVSFAALDAMMDRVAATLQRAGIRPTEAVAICAGTSLEYAAVFLGALRAGIAVAPLAPSSTPQTIADMAANAEARLFFVDAAVAGELAPVRDRIGVPWIALDESTAATRFSTWLAPAGSQPKPVAIRPDWPFNIIYSSGTTGTPKGIVQPHGMRWVHAQRARDHGYGPDAVTLVSTPLYSNTTLVSFFPAVVLGGTAVLMPKFDAARYLELAQGHRATHSMLVPVQYARLMAHREFDRHDLSAFRMKFCTSAPFAAALKADILRRWPGGLIEYYGMTEGGGTVVLKAHEHPHKLATVGQPAEGHDIRLIDEAGREVAPGEIGEIVGHSPAMMRGYHRQPDKTREAEWYAPDGMRFIRTGDVGRFDADGFLTLMDRKKDMIISGGFNVYPSDLEAVLARHPAVAEAAVIGIASQRWGETPLAFVALRVGAGETPIATTTELRDWANARLGKTQRLAAVNIVSSLPRNAIGKILKRELRDRYTPPADL
ncbi:MAG: acyl--CoA ligase [Sulfuritalea sp.]|jgi:acyl-CoA synthetase (AMP-forming)/AMP-acid ligase II|nr:acyl--CoA ligase [Sulfuritalea sp.]MBK8762475.1 acyl--CoA ligase [Sulfuritalea sp.]MBK9352029.1 acyl--CoA ligase [Sulfuritalea sp.]